MAQIVLVVGIYKSGTSIATKLVEEMGFATLADLATDFEPGIALAYRTHESVSVNNTNNELIRLLGGHIANPPHPFLWTALVGIISRICAKRVFGVFQGYSGHVVVKDPRFCVTLPVWINTLKHIGQLKIIWVFRDSEKIVSSWLHSKWCRKYLQLTSLETAFNLERRYEWYLRRNYRKYSARFDSFTFNLEFLRMDPRGKVKMLASFLQFAGTYEHLTTLVKKT
jgi:hypothetical protein